jgi:hypothetical protein
VIWALDQGADTVPTIHAPPISDTETDWTNQAGARRSNSMRSRKANEWFAQKSEQATRLSPAWPLVSFRRGSF